MIASEPVRDFMGREIKAGDTVVYPVRQGSKMWLSKVRVVQVFSDPAKLIGNNLEGRRIEVHKLANVVVVERVAPATSTE